MVRFPAPARRLGWRQGSASGLPGGLLHGGRDNWQREVGGRLHNRLQRLHWLWLWSLHRRLELRGVGGRGRVTVTRTRRKGV